MNQSERLSFHADCPSRLLLDEVADKWSILVLAALQHGPMRFNQLLHAIDGISKKSLSVVLRRLERNGIVSRDVLKLRPIAVAYCITPLGWTLVEPFAALYDWTQRHLDEVDRARQQFDQQGGHSLSPNANL
ncbi:helix-turn-helix domain-containing protein [Methylobacterium sp. SD21]|uniref:winged helix-turn-helix transcriptional regulator n=1 Tax=Methylobacterium litchii TaxID=3138810 RepID=UPI00313E56C0